MANSNHSGANLYSANRGGSTTQDTSDYQQKEIWLVRSLMCSIHGHLEGERPCNQGQAQAIVRRIMTLYGRLSRTQQKSQTCYGSQPFKEFILYSAAYLCYNWSIEDSRMVSNILIHMYKSCGGHFMILFQRSLPHPIRELGWIGVLPLVVSQFSSTDGRMCPFAYFAHHAHNDRLRLRNVKFVDLRLNHPNGFRPSPVYLAASVGEAELLKFLLQIGADVIPKQNVVDAGRPPWIATLIAKLLSNALRDLPPLDCAQTDIPSRMIRSEQKEISCLRLLLRVVDRIDLRWLELRKNEYWKRCFATGREMVNAMTETGLIPTLKSRCLEPSDLKHSCRVAIRNYLRMNWQLPEGLSCLIIPQSLVQYLNIEED